MTFSSGEVRFFSFFFLFLSTSFLFTYTSRTRLFLHWVTQCKTRALLFKISKFQDAASSCSIASTTAQSCMDEYLMHLATPSGKDRLSASLKQADAQLLLSKHFFYHASFVYIHANRVFSSEVTKPYLMISNNIFWRSAHCHSCIPLVTSQYSFSCY